MNIGKSPRRCDAALDLLGFGDATFYHQLSIAALRHMMRQAGDDETSHAGHGGFLRDGGTMLYEKRDMVKCHRNFY